MKKTTALYVPKQVFYTAEELKKLFESKEWKTAHRNNVKKYFKKGE